MDKYEATAARLTDAASRKQIIQNARRTIKWSFVGSVAAMLGAFAACFGKQPAVVGIVMGVAAVNLIAASASANSLILALYIDKTEKRGTSDGGDS